MGPWSLAPFATPLVTWKEWKRKNSSLLTWCSSSTDKKLVTTQDRQIPQNSDKKQYCQYWMLRLVVAN